MPQIANPSTASNSRRYRYGLLGARVLQPFPSSTRINRNRFSRQMSGRRYRNRLVFFHERYSIRVQLFPSQSRVDVREDERRKILSLAAFRSLSFASPFVEKQSSALSEDGALRKFREFLGAKRWQCSYCRYHLAERPWLSLFSSSFPHSYSICRNRRNLEPSLHLLESLQRGISER